MKQSPHLIAGMAAILISVIAAVCFTLYSQSVELNYVNSIAPLNLQQTVSGLALQRAGLQKPDLLPMYGSSEVTLLETEYQADKFFKNYPTGFTVMEIANLGASSITMAQDLGALGPDLKDKKIVISFSPATFTMGKLPPEYYAGNYSQLHAYETLFSPHLSTSLKAMIANRMADFPDTYKNDPFLSFVIFQLMGKSRIHNVIYYLSWPLGRLQIEILRLQDHAAVMSYLSSNPINPNTTRVSRNIDWSATHSQALAEQKLHSANNPLGVEDNKWWVYANLLSNPIPPGSGDKRFTEHVLSHAEWSDLDILLQVLKQLGAQPLLLSRPINEHLWIAKGISEQAQDTYYEKLNATVAPYHFTLVDYKQYATDIYFSIDLGAHTSREGWVYVDQTLDDFYHGRIR